MIKSLLNTSKYPDNPKNIQLIQTHISYVFISETLVYKIKKPVNFGFLDFTTLEKRQHFCNREIILNKRLSPHIYLKTVTVSKKNNDYFYDISDGEIVDYAVVMNKVNEAFLLKNLLNKNRVTDKDFQSIAKKLYQFHNKYPAKIEDAIENASVETLKFTTDENFQQTEKYVGITIDKDTFADIKEFTDTFYQKNGELLKIRIEEYKIKECHGDLHLEHVGIENGEPFFLDCIEFNERFRITDTANEIAFLSMDLDFNGFREFSKKFIEYYIDFSNDNDAELLVNFYKVYRAYVRGKVTSFLIDDPNIPDSEKEEIISKAKSYFNLANSYLSET